MSEPQPGQHGPDEQVVLLDPAGHAIGVAAKAAVHTADTPLHLAFSCYVFNDSGELLLSQRALDKRVFPGLWTNSLCGHPGPGEDLISAIHRRADYELGLEVHDLRVVLPGFGYRAEMAGIVENELCPVVVAGTSGQPQPNPIEVEATHWVEWARFAGEVLAGERDVSPWCRQQVEALSQLGPDPSSWPTGDPGQLPPALLTDR